MDKKMIKINQNTNNGPCILSQWEGDICSLKLHNPTDRPVALGEIDLVKQQNPFPPEAWCYGEGYSMLSQYQGTASSFTMFASHGDNTHYGLFKPKGYCQAYNMMIFSASDSISWLVGFASCNRFTGIFRFHEKELKIVLDGENTTIQSGETIELEQLFFKAGERNAILAQFAKAIQQNHPRLEAEIPTGWSSWSVYGSRVTEKNILDNLKAIKAQKLPLKYIQIDDGYQEYMGDWLSTTSHFENGLANLCKKIKEEGFEPAIWVAPFIAESRSALFTEHPDWFVKDEKGYSLSSDRNSFGGWRCGPWYMLDGTHPEAREYLTEVFRTMRQQWGITYFKLDANMWGALPFGHRYDDSKTCVQAYRLGMEAILEGAGRDSFVLGCNAPMWPSLGLVHGMRLTNDVTRKYSQFCKMAQQLFPRNWQNGKLWINDPDSALLQNKTLEVVDPAGNSMASKGLVTEAEFLFNAAYIIASGGMVLSGDDITVQSQKNQCYLRKLLPPTGSAAVFDDHHYEVGRAFAANGKQLIIIFNYGDECKDFVVPIRDKTVIDYWLGQPVGIFNNFITLKDMPPHSAKILVCEKVV